MRALSVNRPSADNVQMAATSPISWPRTSVEDADNASPSPRRSPQLLSTKKNDITKENASEHPPPDLKKFKKLGARGLTSEPAIWFKKMTGKEWDGDGYSYKKEKERWRGWMGANEKRTKQRRESYFQTKLANERVRVA